MNLICDVTLKCMKRNKRRTVVTILGVIISVAMIAAVSTIASSFLNLMQRNEIAVHGDWYVEYVNIPENHIEILKQDEESEKLLLYQNLGYAVLEGSKNQQRPYVYVTAYECSSMDQIPGRLITGTYPVNKNEIMIPISLLKTSGVSYRLNDEVTFAIGDRNRSFDEDDVELGQTYSYEKGENIIPVENRTYTITGVYDDAHMGNGYQPGYPVIQGMTENEILPDTYVQAKVKTKTLSNALYEYANQMQQKLECENVSYNNSLLMYYGVSSDQQFMMTILMVVGIVGMIILIGSVSLIYNAFAISLSERSRYLGMLSSIGATRNQKRNSVFYEAFFIGIIAIPLGFLFGYAGIGITFQIVDPLIQSSIMNGISTGEHLTLIIEPLSALAAFLFSILILFISAWIPARRASRITAMDAIRQSSDITISKKSVKTSRITGKLFGFEAELAIKNMKRNRSRYLATLFSLIISIVLFLSVSAFRTYMSKSYEMTTDNTDYNVIVRTLADTGNERLKEFVQQAMNTQDKEQAIHVESISFGSEINPSMISDDLQGYLQESTGFQMNMYALDDASFQSYCKEIGADPSVLQENKSGILVNTILYQSKHEYRELELFKFKAEDQITMEVYDNQSDEFVKEPLKIGYVTNINAPFLQDKTAFTDSFSIIVSQQVLNHLSSFYQRSNNQPYTELYFKSMQADQLENDLIMLQQSYGELNTSIINLDAMAETAAQTTLFISIFLYGFVALILLVCMANIFNTISTGLALRKQEFAILKSVGITPKSFSRMLAYENIFYAMKALAYGLPISVMIMYAIYQALASNFGFSFYLPWTELLISICGIFLMLLITMLYSLKKVKEDSIIEAIRNESI